MRYFLVTLKDKATGKQYERVIGDMNAEKAGQLAVMVAQMEGKQVELVSVQASSLA